MREQSRELGRGRSAIVYCTADRQAVRKVFTGDRLSGAVLIALTGAPNPYRWCSSAIQTASARRRVLEPLVQLWFGARLRLPRLIDARWNAEASAYELVTELIDGRHLPLRGPDPATEDRLCELRGDIMGPLQRHLREAGIDGLVWQAGLGNPTATANFMLSRIRNGSEQWVWIDLESGVPALFALNPLATLGYYLPRCAQHRGWLFDDIDVPRLRRYVRAHRDQGRRAVGADAWQTLERDVDDLEQSQLRWKTLSRHQRGIDYERSRGRLSTERARYYASRPLRWTLRSVRVGLVRALAAGVRLGGAHLRSIRWSRIGAGLRELAALCIYPSKRVEMARRFVSSRIASWECRRYLSPAEATQLDNKVHSTASAAYLADFGVHLAIKPVVKIFEYGLVPLLFWLGIVDLWMAGALVAAGGPMARGAYSLARCGQALVRGEAPPTTALVLSFVPVAGNFAYPVQLLRTGARKLPRFILLDAAARVGAAIPIWGGKDSLLEHLPNRIAASLLDYLAPSTKPAPSAQAPLRAAAAPPPP